MLYWPETYTDDEREIFALSLPIEGSTLHALYRLREALVDLWHEFERPLERALRKVWG
jgi:hypothetical protein